MRRPYRSVKEVSVPAAAPLHTLSPHWPKPLKLITLFAYVITGLLEARDTPVPFPVMTESFKTAVPPLRA